jgi:predicted NAD/FAD-dependent oxidoreductase
MHPSHYIVLVQLTLIITLLTDSPSITVSAAMATPVQKLCHRIAVVGGGITGASVASTLANICSDGEGVEIHVFDQGRSGVGGRTSHRIATTTSNDDTGVRMQWDHGCQFFRADTPRFQDLLQTSPWTDIATEWNGKFMGETGARDFFGLPSQPPFYVGNTVNGIKSIAQRLLHGDTTGRITVHEGSRVANMVRDGDTRTWTLLGTTGEAAYHDASEAVAKASKENTLGPGDYDAVVLTDVSSSFEAWHRASAGVPPSFAKRVRERAGARVPLFTCMIAFEKDIPIDMSAATLNDETLWFAARTKSKPGLSGDTDTALDCWTLVSTPEYAMKTIEETPMQDAKTGEFIPQAPEYLTKVPGPQLEAAFRRIVQEGRLGGTVVEAEDMPKTVFLNAQRWGSALPANRYLDETSSTRQIISGVAYDSGAAPLSPTTKYNDELSFVTDADLMLFQAGDMVASCYTPGFEGAALSGIEVAEYIDALLKKTSAPPSEVALR